MKLLKKIIEFLKKPFPQEESRLDTLKIIIGISVFVTLFLYIFQPFDMSQMESGQFLICLCFGAMTFIASVIYEFGIIQVLNLKKDHSKFTFGKWIIYVIGIMLCISLANFLFVRLMFFDDIRWYLFHYTVRGTFAVGIFPVVVLGGLALLRQEKKYQGIADEMNRKTTTNAPAKHQVDQSMFDIPIHQIRYVEALQNYVKIGYINTEGQLTSQTERATLKRALDEVQGSFIVKCHRSFLVNQEAIISTAGNAQGLQLTLADCEKIIPVSRSYVAAFRKN